MGGRDICKVGGVVLPDAARNVVQGDSCCVLPDAARNVVQCDSIVNVPSKTTRK